jgi:hypothetical protein
MSPTSENKDKKPKRKKGETAKDKVRRHVIDKDDHITEEDLRDVVIGVNAMGTEPDEPVIQPEDLPEKRIVTPWDVVNGKE